LRIVDQEWDVKQSLVEISRVSVVSLFPEGITVIGRQYYKCVIE